MTSDKPDQPEITPAPQPNNALQEEQARLEQKAGPLIAARFHVDHRAGPAADLRIAEIGGGAQKAVLLAIAEQSDDRMAWRQIARLQGAEGFQNGGDTGGIIACAGTGGNSTISSQYFPSTFMASTSPENVTGFVMNEFTPSW